MDLNRLLLAAVLLFGILLGATEVGRLSTDVRALAAAIGAVLLILFLRNMPRSNDLTDRLVLAGLLLFLLTCTTTTAPRASFEAATSAMAYVAAFYLARGALADEANRRMAITIMGLLGFVIGVSYLVLWGSIWLQWVAIPGAGAPPFDLRLPAVLYAHQYAVGMLAVALLPATIILARRPIIWPLGVVGGGSILLVAVISGGRTVWLAAACAAVVALLGTRGFRQRLPRRSVVIAALVLGLAGLAVVAGPLWARLAATSTIELRLSIWGDALSHWLDSVLVGFGPGSFAPEFATTGYYSAFERDIPHAHNGLVQLLFEGGLVGVAGAGVVCAAVIMGAKRAGITSWSAAGAFTFMAVASLTDNPTVFPFLIVPLIVWAALASPRAAPATRTEPRTSLQLISLAMATLVGAAVVATFTAAWAFDRARDIASAGGDSAVVANLKQAVAFDPSFALYHRELGAWLGARDPDDAIEHLQIAVTLNPSDTQAVRHLAFLHARQGDEETAIDLTSRLVADYEARVETAVTVAYVNSLFHKDGETQSALVNAVRRAPWLTAAPEWRQAFPDADIRQILRDAHSSWSNTDELSVRDLSARVWLAGLVGLPPPSGTPIGLQLQSAILRCRTQLAEDLYGRMDKGIETDFQSVLGQVMFQNTYQRATGVDANLSFIFRLRDPGLARFVNDPPRGPSVVPDAFQDVTFYDRIPLPAHRAIALPTSLAGLTTWLRNPHDAAHVGAPESNLAECN